MSNSTLEAVLLSRRALLAGIGAAAVGAVATRVARAGAIPLYRL